MVANNTREHNERIALTKNVGELASAVLFDGFSLSKLNAVDAREVVGLTAVYLAIDVAERQKRKPNPDQLMIRMCLEKAARAGYEIGVFGNYLNKLQPGEIK